MLMFIYGVYSYESGYMLKSFAGCGSKMKPHVGVDRALIGSQTAN